MVLKEKRLNISSKFFIVFFLFLFTLSIAYGCEIIQPQTSERITYCRLDGGFIKVTDKYVNFLNESGLWERVNMTFINTSTNCIPEQGEDDEDDDVEDCDQWMWGVEKGIYKTYFTENPDPISYLIKKGNYSFEVTFEKIKEVGNVEVEATNVSNNVINYNLSNFDFKVKYIALPYRVKEIFEIPLSERPTLESIGGFGKNLTLKHNVKPIGDLVIWTSEGIWDKKDKFVYNIYLKDSNNTTILYFPDAFAYDSNGSEIQIMYKLKEAGNKIKVELHVPLGWLLDENRIYPIYIDPTTSLNESKGFITDDVYTEQFDPTGNKDSNSAYLTGVRVDSLGSHYHQYSYYEINFTNITASVITDAKLYVYTSGVFNDTSETVTLHSYYCNDTFDETTLTWNNQGTEVINCVNVENNDFDAFVTTGYLSWDFTNNASNELSDDQIFSIKIDITESISVANKIKRYQTARREDGSNQPYFEITYDAEPQYSNISANNTNSGEDTLFSVYWTDATNLSGYIFSINNTGTWVNDSFVAMTGTGNWSNVTKTINSTVGLDIGWRVYANNTNTFWNNTGIQTLTTTDGESPVLANDTRTPSSVVQGNSVTITVDAIDNVNISEVWVDVVYPNGTHINWTMSLFSGDTYRLIYTDTNALGTYSIPLFYTNDTTGNNQTLSSSLSFDSVTEIVPGGGGGGAAFEQETCNFTTIPTVSIIRSGIPGLDTAPFRIFIQNTGNFEDDYIMTIPEDLQNLCRGTGTANQTRISPGGETWIEGRCIIPNNTFSSNIKIQSLLGCERELGVTLSPSFSFLTQLVNWGSLLFGGDIDGFFNFELFRFGETVIFGWMFILLLILMLILIAVWRNIKTRDVVFKPLKRAF